MACSCPTPDYSPRRLLLRVPRPDLAAFSGGRLLAYLDAKYRDIWQEGLPRDMLYQIALYAATQDNGMATILYPTDDSRAIEERLLLRNPHEDVLRGTVALRPVYLPQLEQLINQGRDARRATDRVRFAKQLIGGVHPG